MRYFLYLQLILCFFHLGFVTSFLSDSFISGYTTGTAILVFTSQVPDIFGLSIKRYVGPFNIIYVILLDFFCFPFSGLYLNGFRHTLIYLIVLKILIV